MVAKTKLRTANRNKVVRNGLLFLAGIILLNVVASRLYKRIDLTKEKRYTLSSSTVDLVDKLDDVVYVTIFLDGDLPLEYDRLKSATRDMLNEYKLISGGKIKFDFEDVLEDKDINEKEAILKEFFEKGLKIERPETKPDEAPTDKFIIPAGVVFYKGKEYPLNLLKRDFGKPLEEEINSSIELLEYVLGCFLINGIAS